MAKSPIIEAPPGLGLGFGSACFASRPQLRTASDLFAKVLVLVTVYFDNHDNRFETSLSFKGVPPPSSANGDKRRHSAAEAEK